MQAATEHRVSPLGSLTNCHQLALWRFTRLQRPPTSRVPLAKHHDRYRKEILSILFQHFPGALENTIRSKLAVSSGRPVAPFTTESTA